MVPHDSTQFGTRRSDSSSTDAAPFEPTATSLPAEGTTTAVEPARFDAPAAAASPTAQERVTYLLVDGENIDATLGMSLLERKPKPEERPRWEKVMKGARKLWHQDTNGLFFLNGSNGHLPFSFVAALRGFDYQVIPLAAPPKVKVVDVGIQRMLDAILAQGHGDVILASHDIDFHDQIEALLDDDRRVAVLCFRELLSAGLHDMEEKGLQVVDLEDDFEAFKAPLPRLRIIDLDAFDPTRYL